MRDDTRCSPEVGPALVPDWMLADSQSDWRSMRPVAERGWPGTRPREHHNIAVEQPWALGGEKKKKKHCYCFPPFGIVGTFIHGTASKRQKLGVSGDHLQESLLPPALPPYMDQFQGVRR